MSQFDIPVVIFIFRREKAVEVIKRIGLVKPKKLYILADNGRNEKEIEEALHCRELVEKSITWECEVIKNYADKNRGVFENIGLGAKWVFEREKWAIFLEDDNLPEVTFFQYCKELLELYENDTRVLWICGTNYLGKYEAEDGSSYMFTKHLLPCGWASWSDKFNRFYDCTLSLCENKVLLNKIKKTYIDKRLFYQYRRSWLAEYNRIKNGKKPISWDYHMDFSLKANNVYGISPIFNQIKNIGVDEYSTHKGNSFKQVLTSRFCSMDSYKLEFPLKHPLTVLPDNKYEKKISKIMLYPLSMRIKFFILRIVRKVLKIPQDITTKQYIKSKLKIFARKRD